MRARRRCCASSPGVDKPDTGQLEPGHGLRIGYYAQEHETIDVKRTVLENMVSSSPNLTETEARRVLGSFLFTGDDWPSRPACCPAARRPVSPSR